MSPDLTRELPDIPIQPVNDPVLASAGIRLSVLRLDLLHPVISGNKWFKLKYNLARARQRGLENLLSFGGPWSNHLHALAFAGAEYGFSTTGIVRGELPETLTACLLDARKAGMHLNGIPRCEYAQKHDAGYISQLQSQFGPFYLIPEGGANREGIQGCAEISSLYSQLDYDMVCLACGTGTTLAGMALSSRIPLMGFQVLKGAGYLAGAVKAMITGYGLQESCPWHVNGNFHFGGYARVSPELMQFLTEFEMRHGIPLEPVYSGKLLYGIYALAKKRDIFPRNSRILAIHGGGLQGLRGYL
jgi:1-aminocyclopropane-1-carboxylate deaminase